jgi:tRNA (guanine37-N1)-methyltransferase
MRIDVITLFPDLFEPFQRQGVVRRAYDSGAIELRLWQLRDFATGNYRRIDDRPFGGGPGMVMAAQPLIDALTAIKADRAEPEGQRAPVVVFSPQGESITHRQVSGFASANQGAILICGRYEGIDQRFIDRHVDQQWSLGDFVLSGGEIAAIAWLDAVARLLPGVLGDADSHGQDSFNPSLDGLLDCPHYTRPEVWEGVRVPEALLSGNHAAIAAYRRHESLVVTARSRPDLIEAARRSGSISPAEEGLLATVKSRPQT